MKPKLILPNVTHNSVQDYAAYRGALDAASRLSPSKTIFNWCKGNELGKELRFIYELAYLFEIESQQLHGSCKFETHGRVIFYDELKGWGKISFDGFLDIDFSYDTVVGDAFLEPGTEVVFQYKFYEGAARVVSVKTNTDKTWKTHGNPKSA